MEYSNIDLFKDSKFLTKDILKHKLPTEIFKELNTFVKKADKKRKSKYHFLVEHNNHGKNSYQVSVDTSLFESSLMFGYLIKLGEHYFGSNPIEREIRIRKNTDHFDHYDFWVNFAHKNSKNSKHGHAGTLSGVIYYTDCFDCPTKFSDLTYYGKKSEVLIFPSNTIHEVEALKENKTRITLAFNLYKI